MVLRRDAQGLMVVGGYGAENLPSITTFSGTFNRNHDYLVDLGVSRIQEPNAIIRYISKYIPKVHPQSTSPKYIPNYLITISPVCVNKMVSNVAHQMP